MIINEIERKSIITKNEYENFIKYFFKKLESNYKLQINYYYDTDNFSLNKKGDTLRIRQINDSLKLEYKYNKKIIDDTRICKEVVKEVEYLPKTISINNTEYNQIGSLITDRTNYLYEEFVISLDKNYYLGIVDYEIEIESQSEDQLPDIVQKLDIKFFKESDGKYTRFINKLTTQECTYEL